MRSFLPLAIIVLGICGIAAAQQPTAPPAGASANLPDLFNRKPLAEDPNDDELQKLLKARYNTALEEIGDLKRMYEVGQGDLHSLHVAVGERLCPAAKEALSAAERLEFLQQYVELAKSAEAMTKARFRDGIVPRYVVTQATYARQDAEIELLKLKRDAKPAGR